jgi:hypothetical protein
MTLSESNAARFAGVAAMRVGRAKNLSIEEPVKNAIC